MAARLSSFAALSAAVRPRAIRAVRSVGFPSVHSVRVLSTAANAPSCGSSNLDEGVFPGNKHVPFVNSLKISVPDPSTSVPAFQMLKEDGTLRDGAPAIALSNEQMLNMYRTMVQLQEFDTVYYNSQRQGRVSFYMTNSGEEGAQVGSAAAMDKNDWVYAQYRELGVLMWQGFTLQELADQCFSNIGDTGKGRQMPVHYGSLKHKVFTISSPLATQIPQASGTAYALKMAKSPNVCFCYFGDGAASEGDFHAALNFAATLECPVVFFCRNNGYAISTPVKEQFRGDGIISRAPGYGMASVRVDGNDILAVQAATTAARKYCKDNNAPVLIEAMTYRQGHHSTSDDSARYRDAAEIEYWREVASPVRRFRLYLNAQGLWDDAKETALRKEMRKAVLDTMAVAEKKAKPGVDQLFEDVYATMPPHLQAQQKALREHMAKYPDQYVIGGH